MHIPVNNISACCSKVNSLPLIEYLSHTLKRLSSSDDYWITVKQLFRPYYSKF